MRSRARSAPRRIASRFRRGLASEARYSSTISVWPRIPPRILLKLWAMPLLKVPTVSMRWACCKRISSWARSFSMTCRPTAYTMVSRAMCNRLSSPDAVMQQGRPIASKPRAMPVPSLSTCVTHAHPPKPRATQASLFSPGDMRLTRGTWTIPSTVGPNRAASAGARCCAPRHKISPVRVDALRHIGERPVDVGVNILRLRVDEAHRDARDHMLERGAPPQVDGPCPQLQREIDQGPEQ